MKILKRVVDDDLDGDTALGSEKEPDRAFSNPKD